MCFWPQLCVEAPGGPGFSLRPGLGAGRGEEEERERGRGDGVVALKFRCRHCHCQPRKGSPLVARQPPSCSPDSEARPASFHSTRATAREV